MKTLILGLTVLLFSVSAFSDKIEFIGKCQYAHFSTDQVREAIENFADNEFGVKPDNIIKIKQYQSHCNEYGTQSEDFFIIGMKNSNDSDCEVREIAIRTKVRASSRIKFSSSARRVISKTNGACLSLSQMQH